VAKPRVDRLKLIESSIFRIAQFELETAQHERKQQRRIDEAVTSMGQCIIVDEEEEAIDEYPQLTDHQLQIIRYALTGGPRGEVSPNDEMLNFPGN
jgi:hypothetical protein